MGDGEVTMPGTSTKMKEWADPTSELTDADYTKYNTEALRLQLGNDTLFAARWCGNYWCYVDPCNCNANAKDSSWFPERVFYSYTTCGSPDEFENDVYSGCPNVNLAAERFRLGGAMMAAVAAFFCLCW